MCSSLTANNTENHHCCSRFHAHAQRLELQWGLLHITSHLPFLQFTSSSWWKFSCRRKIEPLLVLWMLHFLSTIFVHHAMPCTLLTKSHVLSGSAVSPSLWWPIRPHSFHSAASF
ncbi:unnamed protein product [Hymenolepis diminuta]|uniref:Uncharacterized protein n=1 Tax=Hymenolepis diminuta TaxID=6216 RepID=A0A564XWC7_HYMDI|nr:unnamed protein product [Hymenolepis diminuta]